MEYPPVQKIIVTQNSTSNTQPNHQEYNESPKCTCNCENKSSQTCNAVKCAKAKIFFKDGIRSVDYVLVWDELNEDAVKPEAYAKRQIFENNLTKEGLEIEYEPQEQNGLNFVKVSQ